MDLRDTPGEAEFRGRARAWLNQAVPGLPPPPSADNWDDRRAYDTHWQALLFEAGYAGLDWPTSAGGRGATPAEHLAFLEESERAGAPHVGVNSVGLRHAGPTIIACGTEEQRRRHLPGILSGEHVWCQGFSEPEAGSDLAAVRTRAVVDGDDYVVSGHKIWTSYAQVADFCELLVRTDPDGSRHRGLSWLVLDMNAPGLEIRPMRTILGSEEFSEVFLDDVRVPVADRVGDHNDGWAVAMVTFSFERGTAFAADVMRARTALDRLSRLARLLPYSTSTAWEHAGVRGELAQLASMLDGLAWLTKRNVALADEHGTPGPGGSVVKLAYSEVCHQIGDLALRLLDDCGLALDDLADLPSGEHVRDWLHALSLTMVAGTSQIQRTIVGERVLGLPKEPR